MRLIAFDGPLGLASTLRPVTSAWGRRTPDGWIRSLRTPDGIATLQVGRSSSGVHGEAWGPGAEWVLDRLDQWIGLDDDPSAFVTAHPLISDLHRRRLGVRFARTSLVFESVLVAVIGQKVTGKEATRGLRGLTARFSEPAPGPFDGLPAPPDPDRIAEVPYHAFHDLGIERRRADTLRRLAREAHRLDRMATTPSATVATALQRFPGVGPWTVAETVAISHGDADAVSVGDFHLKHLVAWHLAGQPRGTDELMVELLEGFRPHRGRVIRLLESVGSYPSYGPRMPLRSFSGY